jgi:hypothetical protein
MINEKEIMPFNFFKYGGIYTGGHNGMRYKIERTGEKPDYVLNVLIWQGPYASTAMKALKSIPQDLNTDLKILIPALI